MHPASAHPPARRRRIATALAAAMLGPLAVPLALPPAAAAAADPPAARDFYDVPEAAVVRELGAPVDGPTPTGFGGFLSSSTPGMGIPLGGIGAGSFMINQSGTFGPWYFGGSQDHAWQTRALPQAAFHVREQVGDGVPTTRTLATTGADHPTNDSRQWEDPLPAWDLLEAGEGSYAALYPYGWTSYDPFATDVSMRFYSPVVAGEDERSSLPVAHFDVRVANHTDETSDVSVMFTMPNANPYEERSTRTGFASEYREDAATGVHAVTLRADDPGNTADAQQSEWTLAARPAPGQSFSYTTSWDAEGDGADVYAPFAASGALGDAPLDDSASAGAVAVSVSLDPGEVTTIPFVLTWDFPQVTYSENRTVWMRRYTEFYGAQTTEQNDYVAGSYPFHQSYRIATDALLGRTTALRDIDAWWSPVATSAQYPAELRGAALNSLANLTFSTSVWENGLVSNTVPPTSGERLGTMFPDTHLHLGVDANADGGVAANSTSGMGTESTTFAHLALSQLFPSIERDRLRAKIQAVLADPYGDPWDPSMNSSTDPAQYLGATAFITWTQGDQPAPGDVWFLDRPAQSVFRMYDYAQRHDDPEFLQDAYPAMQKIVAYLQQTVPDDVALPEIPSANEPSPTLQSPLPMANIYNSMPAHRFDAYSSQFWLLALQSVIATATEVAPQDVPAYQAQLEASQQAYEDVFWRDGYYRYTLGPAGREDDVDTDTVLVVTHFAQHLAELAGLPDLIDTDHYREHLTTTAAWFTPRLDATTSEPTGAINLALAPSTPGYPLLGSMVVYEEGVWPGANWVSAAVSVGAARRFDEPALRQRAVDLATTVAHQAWFVEANGYAFNVPFQWGGTDVGDYIYPNFVTQGAVWLALDAVAPVTIPAVDPTPVDPGPIAGPDLGPDPGPDPGPGTSPDPGGPVDPGARPPGVGTDTAAQQATRQGPTRSPLAATGADALPLIAAAALLVAAGLTLVRWSRSRSRRV